MKIALLGYGKMGILVEQLAIAKGHSVVCSFSRQKKFLKPHLKELEQIDIAIDFSHASAVLDHVDCCLDMKIPLVIGTTGWEEHFSFVQSKVEQMQGSCLYAPNFSIGVYLFQQITAYAAHLFEPFQDYDVSGVEYHHKHKVDAPSGTAKMLAKTVSTHFSRLENFEFTSVRCGHMPGTHTLHFDSPVDTITLTHQARNRKGFAEGALLAAEWLQSKNGFFTFDDMMQTYIGEKG